jgi:hypothetical protein
MIITEVLAKDSTQVPLIENNNMIQTVSAYGPDNSFNERILPGRARGRNDLLDTQTLEPSSNLLTVNGIPITQQIAWSGIEWKCFYQLLGRPPCGGMHCNIEVYDVAVGTVKKSIPAIQSAWFSRNVRQVCEGGFR